jgi:type III pantothenate kinase
MLVCFDVGNTQIYGGFYHNQKFTHNFRVNTKIGWSSDQLGIFLRGFCHEHNIDVSAINGAVISSVVPSLDYHLKNACLKYFHREPLFVRSGVKTGISIKYKASHEVGADLICSAVGATNKYPDTHLFIVDMGTATTVTAVSSKMEFITGLIMPGIQVQATSLSTAAEKLMAVELIQPKSAIAKNTTESIQTGIYLAHLGGIKLIISKLAKEAFAGQDYKVIATGGYARLFRSSKFFHAFENDLVLEGLVKIHELQR